MRVPMLEVIRCVLFPVVLLSLFKLYEQHKDKEGDIVEVCMEAALNSIYFPVATSGHKEVTGGWLPFAKQKLDFVFSLIILDLCESGFLC